MKLAHTLFTLAFVVAACGGDEKKPAENPAVTTSTAAPTSSSAPVTTREAVGNNLTVTDEIFRICHLRAQTETEAAPKFAFDETVLTKTDAAVLDQIATCLTTGPLANRHVKLTGRADPRGTEDYNMSLGAKRAHAVAAYLQQQKVSGTDLNETSRGALDATGTDEESWAKDRRVDIALMP